jgi:hypothetical protein
MTAQASLASDDQVQDLAVNSPSEPLRLKCKGPPSLPHIDVELTFSTLGNPNLNQSTPFVMINPLPISSTIPRHHRCSESVLLIHPKLLDNDLGSSQPSRSPDQVFALLQQAQDLEHHLPSDVPHAHPDIDHIAVWSRTHPVSITTEPEWDDDRLEWVNICELLDPILGEDVSDHEVVQCVQQGEYGVQGILHGATWLIENRHIDLLPWSFYICCLIHAMESRIRYDFRFAF